MKIYLIKTYLFKFLENKLNLYIICYSLHGAEEMISKRHSTLIHKEKSLQSNILYN